MKVAIATAMTIEFGINQRQRFLAKPRELWLILKEKDIHPPYSHL
jgi:hypothetical protein